MMVKARVSRLAMGGWSAIWGYVRFGGAGRKVRAGGCKPQALTPQVVGCQAVVSALCGQNIWGLRTYLSSV